MIVLLSFMLCQSWFRIIIVILIFWISGSLALKVYRHILHIDHQPQDYLSQGEILVPILTSIPLIALFMWSSHQYC